MDGYSQCGVTILNDFVVIADDGNQNAACLGAFLPSHDALYEGVAAFGQRAVAIAQNLVEVRDNAAEFHDHRAEVRDSRAELPLIDADFALIEKNYGDRRGEVRDKGVALCDQEAGLAQRVIVNSDRCAVTSDCSKAFG